MIKTYHDWFLCCHDIVPQINLDLSSFSSSVTPSHLFFPAFPSHFGSALLPKPHLEYLNAVGHHLWSTGGALAWADVWIPTASEMNAKNVQAVSGQRFWRVKVKRGNFLQRSFSKVLFDAAILNSTELSTEDYGEYLWIFSYPLIPLLG